MAIHQQTAGRVLVVTLDNPAVRNALDQATIGDLQDLFDGVAYRDPIPAGTDPDIGPGGLHRPHLIVLRATGDVFCAGAHLGEMRALGKADYQANLAAALEMGAMFRAVRNCPVPVVGCVQGPAYGGGVGLMAACDVVVSSQQAQFAFTEVRLGLVPGVISPLVIDRIGQAAARTWFLTGDPIDGDTALRLGLVDRLFPAADLIPETERLAASLLKGGPQALSLCKSLLEGAQSLGFARSAEITARMIAEARTKPEGQAALQAFLAKEPAPWLDSQAWVMPRMPGEE